VSRNNGLGTLNDALAMRENNIDYAIAFDTDLKNEAQRKVKRVELMREDLKLQKLREQAEIDLNCLLNKFAIAKLERRAAIAQMEIEAQIAC
jgi:hypothetical protein